MLTLHVIIASTRDDRRGPSVADWFLAQAHRHGGFAVERVDLAEVGLPLFDEPRHPRLRQYEHEHTRRWSAIVARADVFVVVTPEYDHGPPAALINALQYLVQEWAYKPMGFVSYGGVSGGTRGMLVAKQTVSALKMVPLVEAVSIPFFTRHLDEEEGTFEPGEVQQKAARVMLDELRRWGLVLRALRTD